jgi:glycosyltransferase involved in cell wall biosynthesis
MSRRLIIHAPNVHQGGGRTLLLALLSSLSNESCGEAVLDSRLEIPFAIPTGFAVTRVRPSLWQRLRIERELPGKAGPESHLLCFHSLPPLRRCPAFVSVFVQNRHVISKTDLSEFPLRVRLRIHLERAWFRGRMQAVNEFIVQTETMRDLLRDVVGDAASIRVMPFLPGLVTTDNITPAAASSRGDLRIDFDFCYIATGEPNKNHRHLIEAWSLLAHAGQFPSLCLTLDPVRFPQLAGWIDEQVRRHGLNIRNVGYVSLDKTSEIYSRSNALIYPSRYESFGLPLLEARQHGLKIAAAELDYVRDVIEPDESFDPESPRSIARAAQRLLGLGNQRVPILDDQSFVNQLFAA